MDIPVRVMAVWVPDWPLVAANVGVDDAAAVFHANRVVAASPVARAAGVRRHMRRREAQSRCPELTVFDADFDRDARCFEAVVGELEQFTPRIEVVRSGLALFPTRGPSRYFGGDDALARKLLEAVGDVSPFVGVADGSFAAVQATRTAHRRARRGGPPIWVVASGASVEYLAPLSLAAFVDHPDLVTVLRHLGLNTLGDLAALPAADVLGRFGPVGASCHRLANGLDERPPATTPPPPDLVVSCELDPPAELVAPIAFAARGLADELHRRLESRGSACTRLVVTATTVTGERSERVWRAAPSGPEGLVAYGVFSSGAIGDRVRWQMDGWLQSPRHRRPSSGICYLELRPDEVVASGGSQLGLWGTDPTSVARAARAVARVQGLLGADAVFVPEYVGGREPHEQIRLIPAGAVNLVSPRSTGGSTPWPGRLPRPAPATVHPEPVPVDVVDASGRSVRIDGRLTLTAPPHQLVVSARRWRITSWAGPWPVDERWWDADRHSRRARFQVVTDDGIARLVVLERGRWWVRATYD